MYTWKRSDLKKRAKDAIKKNYLMCMLAGLILLFASGSLGIGNSSDDTVLDASESYYQSQTLTQDEIDQLVEDGYLTQEEADSGAADLAVVQAYDELVQDPSFKIARRFLMGPMQVIWDAVQNALGGAVWVFILIDFLVLTPLMVGCYGFFIKNARQSEERTTLQETIKIFSDRGYMNVVLVNLEAQIKLVLWSLLLVIPGIIKSYEYRMIPYLLAENPQMPRREAFQRSKEMMQGQKWKAFVLDLSFLPWDLLTTLTFGLAGIFFVYPYEYATNAELYLMLHKLDQESAGGAQQTMPDGSNANDSATGGDI